MALKFISEIAIARFSSVKTYGVVWLGFSVLTILGIISISGMDTGVARLLPSEDETGQTNLLFSSLLYVLSTSLVLVGLGYVVGPSFIEWAGLSLRFEEIAPFLLVLPFFGLFKVFVGSTRGFSQPRWKVYTMNLLIPVSRLIFVLTISLFAVGAVWYSAAYVLPFVLAAVLGVILLSSTVKSWTLPELRTDLYRFSFPLVVLGLSTTLMSTVDNLLLGYFTSTAEVGIYNAAFVLSGLAMLLMNSVGFLFMPVISKMADKEQIDELKYIYQLATKNILYFSLPVILILVLVPDAVIGSLYGQDYTTAAMALQILAIGYFINIIFGRNGDILLAMQHNVLTSMNSVIGLAVNLVLNLLLIPKFGAIGAAFATTASMAFINTISVIEGYYMYQIHPFHVQLKYTPLHILPLGGIIWASKQYLNFSITNLIILGTICILINILLLWTRDYYDATEMNIIYSFYEHAISMFKGR